MRLKTLLLAISGIASLAMLGAQASGNARGGAPAPASTLDGAPPGRLASSANSRVSGGLLAETDAREGPITETGTGTLSPYAWLADRESQSPAPVDTLEQRFEPPRGYARVAVGTGTFGAFLRTLPLAARETPVVSYTGDVIRRGGHPNVAAVVALDVGSRDLQQCADSALRLHAEWLYSQGRRDQAYRTASGLLLSFTRYAQGERLQVEGRALRLATVARRAAPTHALLRAFLDDVFGWANTASLARDARPVSPAEIAPGDVFVMAGSPFGHAVMVLDVATDARGRRALLLGQGYMPAQSFHVLRPSAAETWFDLDEASGAIATPFWRPFPLSALRRLPS